LFHLFFSKTFLEAVGDWTNEVLVSKGKKSVSMKEFYAYMGLEMMFLMTGAGVDMDVRVFSKETSCLSRN
jgi:hypothetical protein